MAPSNKEFHHPLLIRLTHWINFVALGIMVGSGLQIYNASPILSFSFPSIITIGGWLAGARMWHFFAMWILFTNGVVWVIYNIATRHGRRTTIFRKEDVPGVLPMIQYYLRIRKQHPRVKKYNSLQKLAYSSVAFLGVGSVVTGISIYWPVQFSIITAIFGGYDAARAWHFYFTLSFVFFFFGHIFMVIISGWSNFVSIITGWKKTVGNEE
ncbi:MAG: cytochrome b/b6 domain-containing protein [Bacteroidota bacterium]